MSSRIGGRLLLGEQPDLAHAAPAGEQQLADRLATLDLLAAEAPLGPGGAADDGAVVGGPLRQHARRAGAAAAAARRRLAAPCRRGRRFGAGFARARLRAPAARRRLGAARRLGRPARGGSLRGSSACPDRRRAAGHGRSTSATAKQAMPSARPSAPRPSARLPFTVTGAPTASLSRASISARRGASFGASSTTVQSTLPGSQPAARTSATARRSRSMLSAPAQRGVGVGEVLADVAEPGGAEERVGDGVGDHVGVAVAGQAALAGERHAAEDERPLRVVAERVDVEALPDPHRHRSSANDEVDRRRDLEVRGVAVHDHHPATRGLDQRGVVGGLGPGRRARRAAPRPGTPAASAPPRGPSRSTAPPSGWRSVSVTGTAGTAASAPVGDRGEHPLPHARHRHGAGGVVHDDHVGVVGDRGQPVAHRLRAGGAAGHHGASPPAPASPATSGGTTSTTPSHHVERLAQRPVEHARARRGAGTACARRSGSPLPAATTIGPGGHPADATRA